MMRDAKHLFSAADYDALLRDSQVLRQFKAHVCTRLMNETSKRKTLLGFNTKLVKETSKHQTLPGFSYPAGRMVDFTIDTRLLLSDGSYNLRETVNCPETWFNTRMRAALQAVEMNEGPEAAMYVTEQKTPMFRHLLARYPNCVGSEYLGNAIVLGATNADGLRNEDATRLTFEDARFDCLLSFEVLEHIPDFQAALREARRVLRDGGRFYFTAPFIPTRHEHSIRAKIEDGKIVHILEPEWHGDPVTGQGILCFQHFGWSIVDDLRACGFSDVEALAFDQVEYGYYTQDPILVFRAVAGSSAASSTPRVGMHQASGKGNPPLNDGIAPTEATEPSGERYIPTLMAADVAVEHWHRYAIAARLVAGKRVLDIASGEGYGSRMLAETAATVLGVDIDADTVAAARLRYGGGNLAFLEGSCAKMPVADASIDVVVSFETLEHHDQHEEMFREIRRVLAPGGLCIISTPDRVVYSERTGYHNPFHVKELSAPEFRALIQYHFRSAAFLDQKYVRGSVVTGTGDGVLAFEQANFGTAPYEAPLDPPYLLALASDADLPSVPFSILEENSGNREVARLTRLIEDTVVQLNAVIVDRDAYKAAVDEWSNNNAPEVARLTKLIEDTVVQLKAVIVDRDAYKAAVESWSTGNGSVDGR